MADQNNNNEIQKFVNLWSETYKPLAWTSIVYFVFWYPPWTLFCLAWVIFTALISLVSLIIPPLGYCFCIGSVISWRSLARIELLTVSYCINPKNFIKDSITEIERNGGLFYPITKISPTRTAFPGYIQFGAEFVSHQHTRNCFFYFTFYKTFTLLIFVVLFPVFLLISLPPFTLFGLPLACKFTREFGEEIVVHARYFLAPGWRFNGRNQNQNLNPTQIPNQTQTQIQINQEIQN